MRNCNSKVVPDTLTTIFNCQEAFNQRVDKRLFDPDIKVAADFIRDHTLHTIDELMEMLNEMPYYKNWKDYSNMTEDEMARAIYKAQKEYVDALHFFVNVGIAIGLTPDMIRLMYLEKNKENLRRQDEGYDHTMKHLDYDNKEEN